MPPILVFGGEGQLGRELQRQSSQADVPLISVGHMEADMADMTAVARFISRASCSFVVNAATQRWTARNASLMKRFGLTPLGPAFLPVLVPTQFAACTYFNRLCF
jgi:hypothetical protein